MTKPPNQHISELVVITDPRLPGDGRSATGRRIRAREPGPRPDWLRVRLQRNDVFSNVSSVKEGLKLVTVCEEAHCPNMDECWSAGTATFMLMGDICTRRCGFCAVTKGTPRALDPDEPQNTAEAIRQLGVRHAVITSVNRDELPDGGAHHFAETVRSIHRTSPKTRIELLIPDFMGDADALNAVLDTGPDILAHNMESVSRLYRRVRPQADYRRSLEVLRRIGERPGVLSKTGIMLGLGETQDELLGLFEDLREVGCDILTMGQYLSPTRRHLPVEQWIRPETFEELGEIARQLGFRHVESGPMVRSSYMAHRPFDGEGLSHD